MIRYERDPDGGLVAVADLVVGVEHRTYRLPIGKLWWEPPTTGLTGTPVVVVPDPRSVALAEAGARRAAPSLDLRSMPEGGDRCARYLMSAVRVGAEVVIVVRGGRQALVASRVLGGRPLPALPLDDPEALDDLLGGLDVDVNIAVPTSDGDHRSTIRRILEPLNLEAMHHVVEVDPRPAFDEACRDIRGATLSELGAAAAGVLAGRLAAGSRRWRPEP